MYIIKLRIHTLIYSLFAQNVIKFPDNIIKVVQVNLIFFFTLRMVVLLKIPYLCDNYHMVVS